VREFPGYDGKQCVCCKPDIEQAIELLANDNLVWDTDFERIRQPLAKLLIVADYYLSKTAKAAIQPEWKNLIHALTIPDDDFTIESPIVEYRQQKGL
jgi:hypothetical protein